MEKWRKKIGLAVLAGTAMLAFAPNFANANDCYSCDPCYDPCNSCNWNSCDFGGLEVGVDFLWWKPSVGNLDFYDGEDTTRSVCPDWEPGVRVMARLPRFYCDLGLCASYTFIEPNYRHSGCNKTRWNHTYQEWDILMGYDISCNQCSHFKPFFGLAGIVIDENLRGHHRNNDSNKWSHSFWGVGLRAGAEYQYQICDSLRYFAFAHGTLLTGKHDQSHRQGDSYSKCDDCLELVPGFHIGTGFSYNMCICNWDTSFRIGYEFLVWENFKGKRNAFIDGDSDNRSFAGSGRNFGFQGLLVGVGVGF